MKNRVLKVALALAFVFVSANINAQTGYVDLIGAAEKSVPAVVHIKTEFKQKTNSYDYYFNWLFGYGGNEMAPVIATGSGVIISYDGYIVTNNHVVDNAISVEVTLNDKRSYKAKIIGTDPSSDLALLKIDEKNLPYLSYGNSDECKVGQWVLAVGNPLNLNSTVTAGIISAKARNINLIEGNRDGYAVESFIQTDAAVNMGNSGGALVNEKGELVGINAAIESGTGYYAGYSFAIPVNIVKKVIGDIQQYGEVQRAMLGLSLKEITQDFANQNHLSVLNGAYVAGVNDNSDAAKSGIKVGDVITKINNKNISTTSELIEKVSQYHPGDNVSITVDRSGEAKSFNVTLASKEDMKKLNPNVTTENVYNNIVGAVFVNPTSTELARYKASNGVLVSKVTDGAFKNAGIKEGFLITKMDNITITNVDQLTDLFNNKTGGVLVEGRYSNGMKAYYGFGL